MGIADTIAPRSDQMNADDLLAGPRTFTIAAVRVHEGGEQPVEVVLAEFPTDRPWKPGKSMRRVLVAAWGDDEQAYVGRRLTLYNDPDITFGPDKTGGIRVSHMSHIAGRKTMPLTVKRGSRKPFVVDKLPDAPAPAAQVTREQVARLQSALASLGINPGDAPDVIADELGHPVTALRDLTPTQIDQAADALEHMAGGAA